MNTDISQAQAFLMQGATRTWHHTCKPHDVTRLRKLSHRGLITRRKSIGLRTTEFICTPAGLQALAKNEAQR